jgi:SEC-C motif-containing protein
VAAADAVIATLPPTDCPCGSGHPYPACCGRLHRQTALAETPEELMRSRYAAYVVGDLDHVFRTWHPRTRPYELRADPTLTWTGLRIVSVEGNSVEFVASYVRGGVTGELRERSHFERRRGRWVYVDGEVG